MKDLATQFQTFQSNVFLGPLRNLARSLGVSVESLQALGIGFHLREQCWIFPERDFKGNIIGLSKRFWSGKKYMVDSSKRGISFVLNSKFEGKSNGRSILQDFVRVTSRTIKCPICGKSDWCLVSKQDSKDPAEVICPREETGAVRRVGDAGWLHILDRTRSLDGQRQGKRALPDSEKPYLVVEGASDVLTAWDMGFIAVGRPSATGGMDHTAQLLRGKEVIIIGENDSGAGKQGMDIAFTKLKKLCKKVTKILPPAGIKDLRTWYVKHGLTDRKFFQYIEKHGDSKIDNNLLEDPSPLFIARQWLKEKFTNGVHVLIRRHQDAWWIYKDGRYGAIESDALDVLLYKYLDGKYYIEERETKNGLVQVSKQYVPDEFKLRKIKHALMTDTLIGNGRDATEPFTIKGCVCDFEFDRMRHVVFKNGILDVTADKLMPLQPEIFMTSTLPFDYDSKARCPTWDVVHQQWFDDPDSRLLLSQWMGYNFIATNHLETMMIMFGKSGSGKSTVTKILSDMLGPERCTPIEYRDLAYTFGMEMVVGKYAAIISEDQTAKRVDTNLVLQAIKRLTGRNRMVIRKKWKDSFNAELFARVTYECDQLPAFVDGAGALGRRINMLHFKNSFADHVDTSLKDKLVKELPGIANWALKGLKSLIANDYEFVKPEASEEIKDELEQITCPLAAMVQDCCEHGALKFTPRDMLFDLHRYWFFENNYPAYGKIMFYRMLKSIVDGVSETRKKVGNKQMRGFSGIKILPEAMERYLGKPG